MHVYSGISEDNLNRTCVSLQVESMLESAGEMYFTHPHEPAAASDGEERPDNSKLLGNRNH